MRAFIALVLMAGVAACGTGSGVTAPGSAHGGSGVLTLARVNGQTLPAPRTFQTIVSGFLQLDSSGIYTREEVAIYPNLQGGTDRNQGQDHGTWVSRGDSIFLTSTIGVVVIGPGRGVFTSSGAKLRVDGVDYEYTRQP
jgi:hypothetical protein